VHQSTWINRLSPTERKIVRLVSMGFTNREIARDLKMQEATVKSHLNIIYAKVWEMKSTPGSNWRTKLASWYLQDDHSS